MTIYLLLVIEGGIPDPEVFTDLGEALDATERLANTYPDLSWSEQMHGARQDRPFTRGMTFGWSDDLEVRLYDFEVNAHDLLQATEHPIDSVRLVEDMLHNGHTDHARKGLHDRFLGIIRQMTVNLTPVEHQHLARALVQAVIAVDEVATATPSLVEQARELNELFDGWGWWSPPQGELANTVLAGLADAVEQLQRERRSAEQGELLAFAERDKARARVADLEAELHDDVDRNHRNHRDCGEICLVGSSDCPQRRGNLWHRFPDGAGGKVGDEAACGWEVTQEWLDAEQLEFTIGNTCKACLAAPDTAWRSSSTRWRHPRVV